MVFAALFRPETRAEANAAWRAWHDRRLVAEANGESYRHRDVLNTPQNTHLTK